MLDALALEPFANGRQPRSRSVRLERVKADAPLPPAGVEPTHEAVESGRRAFLASGEGWTLRVRRCSDGTVNVTVTAASDEVARPVLAEATTGAVEPVPPDEDAANVRLWQLDCRGARSTSRRIEILPGPGSGPTTRATWPTPSTG